MTRHRDIEAEALDWLVRKADPDWATQDEEQLNTWLGLSYANKAAYWRLEHGWQQAQRIGSLGKWDEPTRSFRNKLKWWHPVAAAASVMLIVGFDAAIPESEPHYAPPQHFQARIGERTTVPLPDGTKVEINTGTAIRVAQSEVRREVWLDTGEAFFEVAKNKDKPFVVHVGKQTVTVLGTKFSVRRDADKVTVKVLEGRVQVDGDGEGGAGAAIIGAGQFAVTRASSTLLGSMPEDRIQDAFTWRNGMLRFDHATLAEVADEFNRYHRKPIEIVSKDLKGMEVGGTFQAQNVDAFVRLLRDAYGLNVNETETAIEISD